MVSFGDFFYFWDREFMNAGSSSLHYFSLSVYMILIMIWNKSKNKGKDNGSRKFKIQKNIRYNDRTWKI